MAGHKLKKGIINTAARIWKDVSAYRAALIAFAVYYVLTHTLLHAFCPLVLITGFPCAGCGMTRAVFFLLTGQLERSFLLNPMAFPVIAFLVYCFVGRYILGVKIKYWRVGVILILTGMLATYAIRMFTVFPHRPPYVYTRGSLFEKILPHYRDILRIVLGI